MLRYIPRKGTRKTNEYVAMYRLQRALRNKRALEIIIGELKDLAIKYHNDPDVVAYILKLEAMLEEQRKKIIHGIEVQEKKLREMKALP